MSELEEVVAEVKQLAHELVPRCFEVRRVNLAPTEDSAFAIVVRVARCNAEPEPQGWVYDLGQRVRERWGPDDFQLSVREEIVEE